VFEIVMLDGFNDYKIDGKVIEAIHLICSSSKLANQDALGFAAQEAGGQDDR
jgi:hypothetical protein